MLDWPAVVAGMRLASARLPSTSALVLQSPQSSALLPNAGAAERCGGCWWPASSSNRHVQLLVLEVGQSQKVTVGSYVIDCRGDCRGRFSIMPHTLAQAKVQDLCNHYNPLLLSACAPWRGRPTSAKPSAKLSCPFEQLDPSLPHQQLILQEGPRGAAHRRANKCFVLSTTNTCGQATHATLKPLLYHIPPMSVVICPPFKNDTKLDPRRY